MHTAIGLFVFIVFVALYALMFWAILRWARRRLLMRAQRAADALAARGAKILAVRPSPAWGAPAEVEFELDGKHALFQVRRYGRDFILLSLRIDSPPLPAIWIRPEKTAERIAKAMGLHREVQLGDATFDDAAFIASSCPDEVVKKVLGSQGARRAVIDLLRTGYSVAMSPEGLRGTRVQYALDTFDAAPVPDLMRALEALVDELPRLDPATLTHPSPSRFSRVVVGAFACSVLACLLFAALLPLLPPPVDDANSLKAMGLGLIPWPLVVVGIARLVRGRPLALTELLLASGFALLGVGAIGAVGLMAVNAKLDASPAETQTTHVVSNRRGDLRVVPWDPARTWQKVGVRRSVGVTLHTGDTIEVDTHPGVLGWPWVSDVRKISPP